MLCPEAIEATKIRHIEREAAAVVEAQQDLGADTCTASAAMLLRGVPQLDEGADVHGQRTSVHWGCTPALGR